MTQQKQIDYSRTPCKTRDGQTVNVLFYLKGCQYPWVGRVGDGIDNAWTDYGANSAGRRGPIDLVPIDTIVYMDEPTEGISPKANDCAALSDVLSQKEISAEPVKETADTYTSQLALVQQQTIVELKRQLEASQSETLRWTQDYFQMHTVVERLNAAAEDRNEVDAKREELHQAELVELKRKLETQTSIANDSVAAIADLQRKLEEEKRHSAHCEDAIRVRDKKLMGYQRGIEYTDELSEVVESEFQRACTGARSIQKGLHAAVRAVLERMAVPTYQVGIEYTYELREAAVAAYIPARAFGALTPLQSMHIAVAAVLARVAVPTPKAERFVVTERMGDELSFGRVDYRDMQRAMQAFVDKHKLAPAGTVYPKKATPEMVAAMCEGIEAGLDDMEIVENTLAAAPKDVIASDDTTGQTTIKVVLPKSFRPVSQHDDRKEYQ